jgi:ribosome biogenesis GTPase
MKNKDKNLNLLGWEKYAADLNLEIEKTSIARVIIETKGRYVLASELGELAGMVQGKFIRQAKTEADYPKVGDWVLIEKLTGEQKAIIKEIFPRKSKLSRKRAGEEIQQQIIAANVDYVFIVQSLEDYNLKRLERYIAMANEGNCKPVVILNKSDLVTDAQEKYQEAKKNLNGVEVILVSMKNFEGKKEIEEIAKTGSTIALVGMSGAGKSTIINSLLEENLQKTNEVRTTDSKGRHTTTRRELFVMPNGAILIDTPGMRELGLWAKEESVADAFLDIEEIAQNCKFRNCNHVNDLGCAVVEAVKRGGLDTERYESYLKLKGGLDLLAERNSQRRTYLQKRKSRRR